MGLSAGIMGEILAYRDDIDFLEIPSDQFMGQMPAWTDRLMELKHSFTTVAGGLVRQEKPNLSCIVSDLGTLNAAIAGRLSDLQGTLDLNHFFFDAVWKSVQLGLDNMGWFRVHVLPPQQPPGRSYVPPRATPDVFPGKACSSRFGPGVGPVTQSGAYLAPGSKVR